MRAARLHAGWQATCTLVANSWPNTRTPPPISRTPTISAPRASSLTSTRTSSRTSTICPSAKSTPLTPRLHPQIYRLGARLRNLPRPHLVPPILFPVRPLDLPRPRRSRRRRPLQPPILEPLRLRYRRRPRTVRVLIHCAKGFCVEGLKHLV